jgi:hypothetical protein
VTEANPVIRVDLFPAEVYFAEEDVPPLRKVRVIVTQDEFYIFADSPRGPEATHHGRLDTFEGNQKTGYSATLADETSLTFRRAGGCGCGSRLRGFRPFDPMRHGPTGESK